MSLLKILKSIGELTVPCCKPSFSIKNSFEELFCPSAVMKDFPEIMFQINLTIKIENFFFIIL